MGIPVGPGRGSGAGSLAAYCIGITGIDPIRYNLLFERFLNPERVSMPDFDIDFCYERRQEVIDYVVRKYGARPCRPDHHLRDDGRARRPSATWGGCSAIRYQQVDAIAKLVPERAEDDARPGACGLGGPASRCARATPRWPSCSTWRARSRGCPATPRPTRPGVVITRDPVDSYVPLYKAEETMPVTQFTMTTLEELGLLKMDFLGLRNADGHQRRREGWSAERSPGFRRGQHPARRSRAPSRCSPRGSASGSSSLSPRACAT